METVSQNCLDYQTDRKDWGLQRDAKGKDGTYMYSWNAKMVLCVPIVELHITAFELGVLFFPTSSHSIDPIPCLGKHGTGNLEAWQVAKQLCDRLSVCKLRLDLDEAPRSQYQSSLPGRLRRCQSFDFEAEDCHSWLGGKLTIATLPLGFAACWV